MNRVIGFLLCASMIGGCRSDGEGPGYTGPVPSGGAQSALKQLRGFKYRDSTGALSGSELIVVSGFSVIPNPVTGKGPVILLAKPDSADLVVPMYAKEQGAQGFYWIPVLTDRDAEDFCQRVQGEQYPSLKGETSEIYRKTLGL